MELKCKRQMLERPLLAEAVTILVKVYFITGPEFGEPVLGKQ